MNSYNCIFGEYVSFLFGSLYRQTLFD